MANSKQILISDINKFDNKLNLDSLSNDKRYELLFPKNKSMNIYSLREEYKKIKNENSKVNIDIYKRLNKPKNNFDFERKTVYQQKKYKNNNRQNNFITNNYLTINNKSIQRNKEEKIKYNILKFKATSKLINENKNLFFKSLKILNDSINKEERDSFLKNLSYKNYHSSNSNNNFSSINNNLNISKARSIMNKINFNKNGNRNRNRIRLFNKLNFDKMNSISKIEDKFDIENNPITDINRSSLNRFNNFDDLYNFVQNKIKQKKMKNDYLNYYKQKFNKNNFNYRLLYISQNEPFKNSLINSFRKSSKNVNNVQISARNKLSIEINEEITPLRKDNNNFKSLIKRKILIPVDNKINKSINKF